MNAAHTLPNEFYERRMGMNSNIVHDLLFSIGLPQHVQGYDYIVYSLDLIFKNPEYLNSITKSLYIDVAQKFHTTPSSVERSIRFAIINAWKYGDRALTSRIFKNCVRPDKKNPTNSVFLARLYYYITNMEFYK